MRLIKKTLTPDYSSLNNQGAHAQAFENAVSNKLQEVGYSEHDSAADMYSKMCNAIIRDLKAHLRADGALGA